MTMTFAADHAHLVEERRRLLESAIEVQSLHVAAPGHVALSFEEQDPVWTGTSVDEQEVFHLPRYRFVGLVVVRYLQRLQISRSGWRDVYFVLSPFDDFT